MRQTKIRGSAAHKDATVHLFINQSFSPSPDEQVLPWRRRTRPSLRKLRGCVGHADAPRDALLSLQLGDLYKCFGTDGKLVIDYALMEAWG